MGAVEEQAVQRLLAGKPAREVRAVGVEALRRWKKDVGEKAQVQMHSHLGRNMIEILAGGTATKLEVVQWAEVFLQAQKRFFMAPVMDFVWWLIRAALARPGEYLDGTHFALDSD